MISSYFILFKNELPNILSSLTQAFILVLFFYLTNTFLYLKDKNQKRKLSYSFQYFWLNIFYVSMNSMNKYTESQIYCKKITKAGSIWISF